MIQNEQLKHGHQEKWFKNNHENLHLNVTAQEYSELSEKTKKHRDNISLDAQQQGNRVPQTKNYEGCANDLLILAQYAEMVTQSEDSVIGVHTNNQQNKDLHSDLVDQMSREYASNVNVDVTRTSLSQIRKQTRCKNLVLCQERDGNSLCKNLQGKTIRLNQIKHQARCKSKNDLAPQMITRLENEQPRGRIVRFNQMKRQARSKGISTVKDETEKHMDQSLPCNKFRDNERVITGQVMKKNSFQEVSCDVENLKEQQRIARRLRALKTKNLRMKYRRNHSSTGLHAIGTNVTGIIANSEAQKEFVPMKRLRLSQLRREARLGNPFPAMQGVPGN